MKNTLGLLALLGLGACGGGAASPPGGSDSTNGGSAGVAGRGPSSTPSPLGPSNLDSACTVDAPSPRRILRLSTEELLHSFGALGNIDVATLHRSLQVGPIPEEPSSGLAVTRDFHQGADELATRLAKSYVPALGCDVESFGADRACTAAFLTSEGDRLLRGRNDATLLESLALLAAGVAQRSGGATALEYTLRGLLLSPASLYVTEGLDGAKDSSGASVLSPVELASYVSFRVSGRPPSARLLATLHSTPALDANQLTQIVAGEYMASSAELTARFLASFLQVGGIGKLARDLKKHPEADEAFMHSLQNETLQAVLGYANDPTATYASLLTAPQASNLLGDASSPDYARWGRPGVFTLPGLIASTSAGDHTNIPRRGRFLVKNLFCETLQSPPPGAAGQEPPQVPGESERARFERLGQAPGCAGCHSRLHPLAFAFEAYDELGAPRSEDEGNNAVNASAEFVISGGRSFSFDGPKQLFDAVSHDPAAQNCFVVQRSEAFHSLTQAAGSSAPLPMA